MMHPRNKLKIDLMLQKDTVLIITMENKKETEKDNSNRRPCGQFFNTFYI